MKCKCLVRGKKTTVSLPTPLSLGYLPLTRDLCDFGGLIESKIHEFSYRLPKERKNNKKGNATAQKTDKHGRI